MSFWGELVQYFRAKDGHGEVLLQMAPTKHSWGQSEDTLESLVHSSLLRKRTRSNPEGKDEAFMSGAFLESHRSFKAKNSIEDLAPDDGSVIHKLLCLINLFCCATLVHF